MDASSFFPDSITNIPLPLGGGSIYRCSMPCYKGNRSEIERDLEILKTMQVSHIVLLAQDDECQLITDTNLKEKYLGKGFSLINFPIASGTVPNKEALTTLLRQIEEEANKGCKIAIHCMQGTGRTGLVIACLASRILQLSGESAIAWTRDFIPNAVETIDQKAFVNSFSPIKQKTLFEKSMIQLPFEFIEGCIFRTQMPGYMDTKKQISQDIKALKDKGITDVILLATDEDCLKHSGLNLKEAYEAEGLLVWHFPIKDFGTPDKHALTEVIGDVAIDLQKGIKLAVHCSAGKGRTGLFLACLARKILGLSGNEAIEWVRETIPGAVETTSQKAFVTEFIEEGLPSLFSNALIPLPYDFKKGVIYRSIIPGCYVGTLEDKEHVNRTILRDILTLKAEGISRVLMLISEEESVLNIDTNLKDEYAKHDILAHSFPIKEIEIPNPDELKAILKLLLEEVSKGNRIAIHCRLGIGRTALVAACLAKWVLKLSSEEAIVWVKAYIPSVLLSVLQIEFLHHFDPGRFD